MLYSAVTRIQLPPGEGRNMQVFWSIVVGVVIFVLLRIFDHEKRLSSLERHNKEQEEKEKKEK